MALSIVSEVLIAQEGSYKLTSEEAQTPTIRVTREDI